MTDVTDHDKLIDHESAYTGLLGGDPSHWAFGTDFDDPLGGIEEPVADGVDPADLATYCLMLADDALVLSSRLAEWCSRAPELEEDIALANIALDLLGQARLLLIRAAHVDPAVVPVLPAASPVPAEDALAYFRDASAFRNVRLVEPDNGDFAATITRLLIFGTWRLAVLRRLVGSRDPVLAAVAEKGVKEVTYHCDYAGRWFLTLAQGTAESRRRLLWAVASWWPMRAELFAACPLEVRAASAGVAVDPSTVRAEVDTALREVFDASAVDWPPEAARLEEQGGGRDGVHTEDLVRLLAEMQEVARAHPLGRW